MRQLTVVAILAAWLAVLGLPGPAPAETLHAELEGIQEPPSVSTVASGEFRARISRDGSQLHWVLSYTDLEAPVQQAHIHFGQRSVNGGISVFFCTNLANGPAGTQLCPASPATIEGTATAVDVVGPTGQGIAPGEFAELLRAIRNGVTYANVHSAKFPGGEIRGQIKGSSRDDDD